MLALVPTPIGVGPEYRPRPAVHGLCVRRPLGGGARVHIELFANGRVVIVPAGVGLGRPLSALGLAYAARCRARLWTLDPTGVVHVDGRARLADLFGVWGARLAPGRLLGFRGAVRVYLNGLRRRGPPGALALRDGDEIVLEVGPYIPPHRSYLFPLH